MKHLYALFCLAATLAVFQPTVRATDGPVKGFEENKGQVHTMAGVAAPHVRYHMKDGSTHIFLLNDGIAYQFQRTHMPDGLTDLMKRADADPSSYDELKALQEQVRIETFRMDMRLDGADHGARITTAGCSNDYVNYYNRGAMEVHSYERVTYHDVYPGIDWVVYTHGAGIKYDFVVHPGADPDRIRMVFEHQEELQVDATGKLIHGNRMGRFTEAAPVSFQDGRAVATQFVLEGNALRFALGEYDATRPLTIDPARLWGTYYGGNAEDRGRAVAVDAGNNVYLAGYTTSLNDIAAGGHQMSWGGFMDAMLVKFTTNGVRLWATYYGGSSYDYGRGCDVDSEGNVYLAGYTRSGSGIAFNGHQMVYADGGQDAFLAKFNSAGVLQWGTYYGGGEGSEVGRACSVDANDQVYLAGYAGSFSGIGSGGHQNAFGGGSIDAFLAKFDANGVRQWGTYYGGSEDEGANSCEVDADGNVYLTGRTSTTTGMSMGGHQMDYGGGAQDAYLAKFNSSGTRLWATYYGGDLNDEGEDVAVDASGNVFLSGYTLSTNGISSAGVHQTSYGGGLRDAILVKFNSAGVRQWATYYGGDDYDTGWTCTTDAAGNIYLGGSSGSASGIAIGGHQNTHGGNFDAFFAKFDGAGVRAWGTYYGYVLDDDAYGSVVDGNGDLYMAGTTRNILAIADGGHQNSYGGEIDGFLAKFDGDLGTSIPSGTESINALQWYGQQGSIHQFDLGELRPTGMELIDASGHVVRQLSMPASNGRLMLDLGGLAPGMYLLRTVGTTGLAAVRLVHQ